MNFFALGKTLSNLSKSYGYAVMMRSTGMTLGEYQLFKEGISIFNQSCIKPFFKNCKNLVKHTRRPKVQSIKFSPAHMEDLSEILTKNPRLKAALLDMEGSQAISVMHYDTQLGIVA